MRGAVSRDPVVSCSASFSSVTPASQGPADAPDNWGCAICPATHASTRRAEHPEVECVVADPVRRPRTRSTGPCSKARVLDSDVKSL